MRASNISGSRIVQASVLSLAVASVAAREPQLISERCYFREYSAEHILAHPGQTVRAMLVRTFRLAEFPDEHNHSIAAQFIDADGVFSNAGMVLGGWHLNEFDSGRYRLAPYKSGVLVTADPDNPPMLDSAGAVPVAGSPRSISGRGEDNRFFLPEVDCAAVTSKWR